MRVAVFASGAGTNLQAILDQCHESAPVRVALVASNRPDSGALHLAHKAGVVTYVIEDPADGLSLLATLRDHDINLVVLAGYLKLVPKNVVAAFAGRMINIHPALLPSYGGAGMYGNRVHAAVLDSGATVTGATVHLVTEDYDRGPIIAQWPVPVAPDDTPETLQQRVLAVEHELLPAVVLAAAQTGGVEPLFPACDAFEEVSVCHVR